MLRPIKGVDCGRSRRFEEELKTMVLVLSNSFFSFVSCRINHFNFGDSIVVQINIVVEIDHYRSILVHELRTKIRHKYQFGLRLRSTIFLSSAT